MEEKKKMALAGRQGPIRRLSSLKEYNLQQARPSGQWSGNATEPHHCLTLRVDIVDTGRGLVEQTKTKTVTVRERNETIAVHPRGHGWQLFDDTPWAAHSVWRRARVKGGCS
jgi:hypothetical protein